MAFLFKPLQCPHCGDPMDKRLLDRHGLLKAFLKRQAFACPHCHKGVIYPEKADTPIAIGLFVAVILAPLFHLWQIEPINPRHVFYIGVGLLGLGLMTQKLQKTSLPLPTKKQ